MSYNEGSREGNRHPERSKKRKFTGYQFTDEVGSNFASKSAEKLEKSKDSSFIVRTNVTACYVLMSFFLVFSTLQKYVKCKVCNGEISFDKGAEKGLGFKICLSCECGEKYIDSSPMIGSGYEVNRRLVFVMRLIGIGFAGINTFCGLMDLTARLNKKVYYDICDSITTAVNAVFNVVTRKAVLEEQKVHKEKGLPEDVLSVSGDGSWSKRGFSSLIGIVSLILKFTGKIVDVTIRSSYCKRCEKWIGKEDTLQYVSWYEKHKPQCTINHIGNSGKVEVDGVVETFLRSLEKFAVRYGFYIGDGDSKTFKMLLNCAPYGDDFIVKKLECVLHVAKRVFKRANEAKKSLIQKKKVLKQAEKKNTVPEKTAPKKTTAKKVKRKTVIVKKLPEIKTQNLTIKLMKELSENYGLAVRRNVESIEGMRKEIWAGFYHKISTDAKPQHSNYSMEWCKYLKAKALKKAYKHPPALSADVQEVLKPIYEDLTKTQLLERCLGGHTQNNNESFNKCVWSMAPKHLFNGKQIVEIACKISACIFNEGYTPIFKIMETMGMKIGIIANEWVRKRDKLRIQSANRPGVNLSKEARTQRKKARLDKTEEFEQEEGVLYGAGIAD